MKIIKNNIVVQTSYRELGSLGLLMDVCLKKLSILGWIIKHENSESYEAISFVNRSYDVFLRVVVYIFQSTHI